jgi:hypothetical protein
MRQKNLINLFMKKLCPRVLKKELERKMCMQTNYDLFFISLIRNYSRLNLKCCSVDHDSEIIRVYTFFFEIFMRVLLINFLW